MNRTVEAFGLTHVGKVRRNNEDHFLIATLQKSMQVRHTSLEDLHVFQRLLASEAHVFVVADGVGGVAGGELASGTAVEVLVDHVGHTMGCYYNYNAELEHEFLDGLQRGVEAAHRAVRDSFGGRGRGPATTLTLVTLIWPRAYVVHIGDSRAYYLSRGALKQLTRDQTMGEVVVDEGLMSEEQAEAAGLNHLLASAVGAEMSPAIGLVDLDVGDVLLLCTDGLSKHVSDEAVADALNRDEPAEAMCHRLVDAALENGGSDNVSVIVARMIGT